MNLEAVGHFVLVKHDAPKDQFQELVPDSLKDVGFEVAMGAEQEKREEVGTQIGTVVSIGPMAWKSFDGKDPNWKPWFKVGERVMFARYAGKIVEDPVTHERFMLLADVDLQVKVAGEKAPWED